MRGTHVKKLSRQDREEILAAYAAGATVKGLARDYGVDRGAVYHHLKQAGITLRSKRTPS